ncbi:SEL1-like repeat protein [Sphingomonas sp. XMGL2]|uniref:SEL1-like repeat protein n=2 Tax=Sphingomonas quercus TaxID=2842451 RepID=A0ABS6BKR5_9SPHN|nr:SPOR domain-containing protein [Sphingomonas quercus]MBU3078886.1 SEL1-like repeat protein [Sphingomonas quercus]
MAVTLATQAAQAAETDAPAGHQVATVFLNTTPQDSAAAIAGWRSRAAAGNAEAQYNLGQAYRRGEGVPADPDQAQSWYRKAADQGYLNAEAQLGLMLFTSPRRSESFSWLEKAATAGEPRAQYVLGTALFNGDGVAKDWPRAYAMMSRAAAGGLDAAKRSLATMETYINVADRQRGAALASALGANGAPAAAPRAETAVRAPASAATVHPAKVSAGSGWRIQLGAFGQEQAAQNYWTDLSRLATLRDLTPRFMPANGVTRLQAGPFPGKAAAASACAAIQKAGKGCFLVAP